MDITSFNVTHNMNHKHFPVQNSINRRLTEIGNLVDKHRCFESR